MSPHSDGLPELAKRTELILHSKLLHIKDIFLTLKLARFCLHMDKLTHGGSGKFAGWKSLIFTNRNYYLLMQKIWYKWSFSDIALEESGISGRQWGGIKWKPPTIHRLFVWIKPSDPQKPNRHLRITEWANFKTHVQLYNEYLLNCSTKRSRQKRVINLVLNFWHSVCLHTFSNWLNRRL